MPPSRPSYLSLSARELSDRASKALDLLRGCRLCPRACGADRQNGETGVCGTGRLARIASYDLHFGEEECLVGSRGSGTIFFSGCNLACMFCQNEDISRDASSGLEASPGQLAAVMLELQSRGAANINLVSPSHVAAHVLEALPLAVAGGLKLPIVYNTGGCDSLETLALFDGVVDIHMPDVKFWDPAVAGRLCGMPDYPDMARAAVKAMHAQVGDLVVGGDGLAVRGLLVRHLVLPGGLSGTRQWMEFLAREVSPRTYVNLMGQYRPCAQASEHPPLDRALSPEELNQARQQAEAAGITRFDERGPSHLERLLERMLRSRES